MGKPGLSKNPVAKVTPDPTKDDGAKVEAIKVQPKTSPKLEEAPTKAVIAGRQEVGDDLDVAGPDPEKQTEGVEIQGTPAGKVHTQVLKKVEAISEEAVQKDRTDLAKASLEDLRFKETILETEVDAKEKLKRAKSVREETIRRIKAYASECTDQWFTLNYSKLDELAAGQTSMSHELDIGLGEILRDPDIEKVLVQTSYGTTIEATRGWGTTSSGETRYGFKDENGNYVSTLTGDKFKILSDKYSNLEDEKELGDISKKLDEEKLGREKQRESHVGQGNGGQEDAGEYTVPDTGGEGTPGLAEGSEINFKLGKRGGDGNSKTPYRFLAVKLSNPDTGTSHLLTNGGAPGTKHPSNKSDIYRKNWAKSQMRELYNKGVRVVVSFASRQKMPIIMKELREEGINMTHIVKRYPKKAADYEELFGKIGKYISDGVSVYVHCKHGTHRAPAGTAGGLMASGRVKSLGQAMKLAGLNPYKYPSPDNGHWDGEIILKHLFHFAKKQGLKIETPEEFGRLGYSSRDVNKYRKILKQAF